MSTSTQDPHAQVMVELSDCDQEDAHAVFGTLGSVYDSDRDPDDVPQTYGPHRTTIWAATFTVDDEHNAGPQDRPDEAQHLDHAVTADIQGGYRAVDQLRETLAAAYTVQLTGTVSGDQEREVQLRLDNT